MHSIWAVATNTIKQALRMKVAVVFTVILAVLVPVMGFTTTGDGTLKGRLQTFVSYSLSLTGLFICLLTIIVAIYTLTSDIMQKQIYTVVTKPVRRFQLILGKLLGTIVLNGTLLVLFSALIYAVAVYMPKFSNASPKELAQVKNEFFTARAGLKPPEADVTKQVNETYNKLRKSGQLGQVFQNLSRKKIITQLTRQKQLEKRAAVVGRQLVWEFHNVEPVEPNESLFIRYNYDVSVTPPDLQVYGKWVVGDLRQIQYGTAIETPIRDFDRKDTIGTFHEIEVPGDVVAQDGYLGVAFINVPLNNTVIIFPLEDGLEVLYKADTFTNNFLKAVLLILLRLIFLAVLGILTSTFLSFPVAILVCLVIFFTATFSGFVIDSFSYLSKDLSSFYAYTFKPVIQLLPQFDRFNPIRYLVSARLLSWPMLARAAGVLVGLKAVVVLLFALLIFSYREIAKIIL